MVIASQVGAVDLDVQPHTVIVLRAPDGTLTAGGNFPRLTAGMCVNETGDGVVLVDGTGLVSDYRPSPIGLDKTEIFPDGAYESHQIRFLENIGGILYSGGTNRYLHRRDRNRQWTEFSTDAMRPDTDDPLGFEDLYGFGPDELYAVGWDGALWTNAGGAGWAEVDSPTNLILTAATTGVDRMYAAGQLGTIIEGRGADWRPVEHEETDADIWSAATFQGITYFATHNVILKLEDGEVGIGHLVDTEVVRTAQELVTGPSGLWSIGRQDLVLFDGEEWQSVLQT